MQRISLVAYRRSAVTPDVAEALRQLEIRAASLSEKVRLAYSGPAAGTTWEMTAADPGPTVCPPELSLWPAGREVRLRMTFANKRESPSEALALLWGLAVPLGFTPWLRYPVPGVGDDVFHYYGPWQTLADSLYGEGRGEWVWPSICAAAQIDVGAWEGDRVVERFVQAQLHRLGVVCGPIDGKIGPRTLNALASVGCKHMSLEAAADSLKTREPAPVSAEKRRFGHVLLPGNTLAVTTIGKISSTQTVNGAVLTVDGPGRVILDIRGGA